MLFVISLSAFIAYRAGYISLTNSTSATANQEVAQDSIPVKPDSLTNKTLMHSSKSIIIPFKMSDSLRRSKSRKRVFLMSGSKSGSVFVLDSTQSDSIQPKPIKRRK